MKYSSQTAAFTLIELLIVITIIGVLAAAIVLNFSGVRERQQLSLLADKSVAILQVAQTEVRSGKYDASEGQFFCEGMHLAVGAEPFFVTMPYDREAERCDFTNEKEEEYGLATSPAVMDSIVVDGASLEELYALYAPPDAALHFYDASENTYAGVGLLTATFASGGGGEDYSIALHLSALTGLASLSLTETE